MGDGAEYLMQREIDLETGFAELEKRDFESQMSKRITKMVHKLLRREKEPGHHPFYTKERQEETYFKHKGQGGIIDIRTIDSDYAKNLYNWYIKHHDYDENILFMKTLKINLRSKNYVKNRRFNYPENELRLRSNKASEIC